MNESAQQDLALIRRIMEDSRREVVDRGKHFLIWGGIGFLGSAATYLHLIGVLALTPTWIWGALLLAGWAGSTAVGIRDGRTSRVRTLGRRLLTVVWVASAVSLTLVAVAGMVGPLVPPSTLSGLTSTIIGAPVMVTAVLTGERWLKAVAVGWWSGGAVMLFVPGFYTLLLMGGMSLALLAGPGAVLFARSRRVTSSEPVVEAP